MDKKVIEAAARGMMLAADRDGDALVWENEPSIVREAFLKQARAGLAAARPFIPPLRAREEIARDAKRRADEFVRTGFRDLGVPSLDPYVVIVAELLEDAMLSVLTGAQGVAITATPLTAAGQEWREPEGWKLVPVTPTDEMLEAGYADGYRQDIAPRKPDGRWSASETYRAMLAAAPPVAEPKAKE